MLSFLMIALSGCNKDDDTFNVSFFSVSGCIYDDSGETPVQGVTVSITAYSVDDLDRTMPLYRDNCFSAPDGRYQFSINSSDDLSDSYFVFIVKDEASYRTPRFKEAEGLLFLSPNSVNYNSFMKTYEVKDYDFCLSPEN